MQPKPTITVARPGTTSTTPTIGTAHRIDAGQGCSFARGADPGQVTDGALQLRGGRLEMGEERRIQRGRVAHRCLEKPKQARELRGRHGDS